MISSYFSVYKFYERMYPEEISEVLKILNAINLQLIDESLIYKYKKYSVFDNIQDDSELKFLAFMVYDLAI